MDKILLIHKLTLEQLNALYHIRKNLERWFNVITLWYKPIWS